VLPEGRLPSGYLRPPQQTKGRGRSSVGSSLKPSFCLRKAATHRAVWWW